MLLFTLNFLEFSSYKQIYWLVDSSQLDNNNFLTGSAKYVQLFIDIKLSHWLECFNNCVILACSLVFTVFLTLASRLKIQKSSVKNSGSLLNFSDLWNQNMKLKIHTLCTTAEMKNDTEQTMKLEWLCKVGSKCELNSWPDSSVG